MLVNDPPKIAPGLNAGHVHKHRILTKFAGEISKQAPSLPFSVISAITDEDCTHISLLAAFGGWRYRTSSIGYRSC